MLMWLFLLLWQAFFNSALPPKHIPMLDPRNQQEAAADQPTPSPTSSVNQQPEKFETSAAATQ
jgi:hypothetical protein